MEAVAQGEPIINRLYQFDVLFYRDGDGAPVFQLLQNGQKFPNTITIETHMATLMFTLVAPGQEGVVCWASQFQWLNALTLTPTTKPTNIAFIRDGERVVTLYDSNAVQSVEGEERMHFLFSVVETTASGVVMYTSSDPIIINKKPPV